MIKNYKTITLAQTLTNTNQFSVLINIPFTPTHFYVKNIFYSSYTTADSSDLVLLLKFSLINDTICTLVRSGITDQLDINSQILDLKYKLNPINIAGNYNFIITDINGNIPDQINNTIIQLAVTLCFEQEE